MPTITPWVVNLSVSIRISSPVRSCVAGSTSPPRNSSPMRATVVAVVSTPAGRDAVLRSARWSGPRTGYRFRMAFNGIPNEVIDFYTRLEADNSKSFWEANKHTYRDVVKASTLEFASTSRSSVRSTSSDPTTI